MPAKSKRYRGKRQPTVLNNTLTITDPVVAAEKLRQEEEELDSRLRKQQLLRFPIPKDGACMVRFLHV